jgi:hypothetical protein
MSKRREGNGDENTPCDYLESKRQKLSNESANGLTNASHKPKRRIFFNAFDMFTVGHMSFGQWRNPKDKSATKRRDLSYWTNLARILERGDFNAIFLADTFGWNDVYTGSAEPCVRTGAQFPMGDPAVPVSAMATVTKNLGFAITTSTTFEHPAVLAKRFSTLDHLTGGRFGWNIVTSWRASAFKSVCHSTIIK